MWIVFGILVVIGLAYFLTLHKRRKRFDYVKWTKQLTECFQEMSEFVDDKNCGPIMLRLAWSDAASFDKQKKHWPDRGGANGSIRLEPEISFGCNRGLSKALAIIEFFKRKYPLISWSDLIQMAGAAAVECTGGPKIDIKYGREDAASSTIKESEANCPISENMNSSNNSENVNHKTRSFMDGASTLRSFFFRLGFNTKELVALSGAHTIGRAFHERSGVTSNGYGEIVNSETQGGCTMFTHHNYIARHDGKKGVGMPGGRSWTSNWLSFDNSYFIRLESLLHEDNNDEKKVKCDDDEMLLLASDVALIHDPEMRTHVKVYASDVKLFHDDYAAAHVKMSELGARFDHYYYLSKK